MRAKDTWCAVPVMGCCARLSATVIARSEALIVPSANRAAIREAMAQALAMPVEERRARWEALSAKVERGNVSAWCRAYLEALERAATRK